MHSEGPQDLDLRQQQAYYDARWPVEPVRPHRYELARLIQVLQALHATGIEFSSVPVRICDLGCGRGWISAQLSAFGSVTGIDLSEQGVQTARARWPQIEFVQGDVTKFRPEHPFDVVVSSEVIEHVPDQFAFFATAAAILKPGGHLILTTPNAKLFKHYAASGSEMQPVERWLSCAGLRALAARDFSIIRHETFGFDAFYVGMFRLVSAPKLVKACEALHLNGLRLALHRRCKLGLFQILLARRRAGANRA